MAFDLIGGAKKTSSKVEQYDQRVTATDSALAAQPRVGGEGNQVAQAINGIAVQGKNNTINLTSTDGGAFNVAAGLVTDVLKVTTAAQAAAQAAGLEAVSRANDQLSSLSETKLTDGANLNSKTTIVAIVAFAIMGLLAFLYLRK